MFILSIWFLSELYIRNENSGRLENTIQIRCVQNYTHRHMTCWFKYRNLFDIFISLFSSVWKKKTINSRRRERDGYEKTKYHYVGNEENKEKINWLGERKHQETTKLDAKMRRKGTHAHVRHKVSNVEAEIQEQSKVQKREERYRKWHWKDWNTQGSDHDKKSNQSERDLL